PSAFVAGKVSRKSAVARAWLGDLASRFALWAVDTTALRTTMWPPIQVACGIGRISAVARA
ncbi:hypothetical protein ACHAXH_000147, partial [Discostella pseudostelligera]